MTESAEQRINRMLGEARHKHHTNKINELLQTHNVKVNDEELGLLHEMAHQGKDVAWIVNYMKNNERSLASALVSYHSDWSGAQGNR